MKKTALYLMMMVLLFTLFPTPNFATEKKTTTNTANTKQVPIAITRMYNRLEEIKTIDKSRMTAVEKKALRKEIRTIKANLKSSNGGVYLSIGALIIIIFLLVLLL